MDSGSISGLGRSPRGRHGTPLQYSCLENSMDRGARQAAVHGVARSQVGFSSWGHKEWDTTEHSRQSGVSRSLHCPPSGRARAQLVPE